MTSMATVSIVALLGWLFFAVSAMASYKLGWKKNVQLALIWVAIFAGGFFIASLFV